MERRVLRLCGDSGPTEIQISRRIPDIGIRSPNASCVAANSTKWAPGLNQQPPLEAGPPLLTLTGMVSRQLTLDDIGDSSPLVFGYASSWGYSRSTAFWLLNALTVKSRSWRFATAHPHHWQK